MCFAVASAAVAYEPFTPPAPDPSLSIGESVHRDLAAMAARPVEYAQNNSSTNVPGFVVPPTPTNAPPTPGNFLQSVILYFSSPGTNQTFQTNDTFDIWTGAEYVNNLNTAATLGISWNAWHFAPSTTGGMCLGVESQTRNAGIAGTILSQGIGVNIQKVWYDTKLEGFFEGEKNFAINKYCGELGVRIFKALTPNTFAGFGISEFMFGGATSKVPNMLVFAGAKM